MTQPEMKKPFDSFEQLEQYLANWRSFSDPQVYDPGGMMQLFCMCISNMRTYMNEAELQDFGAGLTAEERAFLQAIVSAEKTSENETM